MHAAQGILTARGGASSHAALVSRGMGKCAIVGCETLEIDYERQQFNVRGTGAVVRAGEWITLDGATGEVFRGQVQTREPNPNTPEFSAFMHWADQFRRLKVRANADTPHDATIARRFGAEGIGLCRTEHMFFEGDRIDAVREMILADDTPGRCTHWKDRAYAKSDFVGILRAMAGLPVTFVSSIRRCTNFAKYRRGDCRLVSQTRRTCGTFTHQAQCLARTQSHAWSSRMPSRRDVPEIYEAQARAIMEAALNSHAKACK
jgi:pyruvate,orthophosphate dikinase